MNYEVTDAVATETDSLSLHLILNTIYTYIIYRCQSQLSLGSLNRVPASTGVQARKSPLPGGR